MQTIRLTLVILFATLACSACARDPLPEIEFVQVPATSFLMGTKDLTEAAFELPPDATEDLIRDETPAHRVSLSAYEIGKYEITQAQWLAVMGTRPGPDEFWRHAQWQSLPVVSISWEDTQRFIRRINELQSEYDYRLPTEAEWEYASRDGSSELRPYPIEQLFEHAWVLANSADVQHPVGQKRPNRLGMYDTFGNAWEWVNDWYQPDAYAGHATQDPQGPKTGDKRVRRGGSYHCAQHLVRSAYRAADFPSQRYTVLGFRLVRTPRGKAQV